MSSLHSFCKNGNLEGVKSLIDKGVDINSKDRKHYTPLHVATCYNYINIILLLLENGADPNIKDKFNNSPLDLAKFIGNPETIKILNRGKL